MTDHKLNGFRISPVADLARARAILEAEAEAIRAIRLDDNFLRAVEILKRCKGKVITTGIGKVGIIAVKLATTLSSTGTPACFLHPGDAAHGDLGVVSKHDVMITFSNSGKTREVLETIERAKKLNGMHLIAVTGHRNSPIARRSDVVLSIGAIKEPCSLGLTPSASTAAMLALSDALALVLMEKKKFTKTDYAKFHHGGYLGKRARREAEKESRGLRLET
jgi:arabinose-5-phosphate isomerase